MKSKQTHKSLGKMLRISTYKANIAKGIIPPFFPLHKVEKIKQQVKKMTQEIDTIKKYQPFTSKASTRKPRQVGA